jgi:hypothetical protein
MTACSRHSWRRHPTPKVVANVIRGLLVAVGALLAIAGTVFALQGFGALGGSGMSGSHFWAAAGPVIAIVGLVTLTAGVRRSRRSLSLAAALLDPDVAEDRVPGHDDGRRARLRCLGGLVADVRGVRA